jgi:uncharacterized protein YajQ (UPF0234 family)
MPSFDIVCKVDMQSLDNAINVVKKEISTRYDFKGSPVNITLNKKEMTISLEVENEMKMRQVEDVILSRAMRQGIDARALDLTKEAYPSGKVWKKEVPVKNGISREDAKTITRLIKDSDLKVQTQIMDDTVRVSGKKIDDLQSVIRLCKESKLELPLQYINMKS